MCIRDSSNEVKTIPSANVETAEIGADTGDLAVNDNGDIIVCLLYTSIGNAYNYYRKYDGYIVKKI